MEYFRINYILLHSVTEFHTAQDWKSILNQLICWNNTSSCLSCRIDGLYRQHNCDTVAPFAHLCLLKYTVPLSLNSQGLVWLCIHPVCLLY